jgi:membrane protease YdiL (CAAX protease family)
LFRIEGPLFQILGGIALALALWGIFWVGDKLSSMMFDFARPEVDAVYSMKNGIPQWSIAALLLVLIGPAEELFWRGYVQRTFSRIFKGRQARFAAFLVTTVIYALVHVWSFNFMLVMAALVAGAVWGFVYMLCPKALPALIVSHALWDALVFVILPI